MKFTIISGSGRKTPQSSKVAHYIQNEMKSLFPKASFYLLDLIHNKLPLFDEGVWDDAPEWEKVWGPISRELASSDGFVVISPEWSGMAPGGLKNIFHLCSKHQLAHKPGLLVGVSSTTGGAYPVAELRMTAGKNTRICFIPDHVIIRNVEKMLNGPEAASDEDKYVRGRLTYSLKVLGTYTEAFQKIRESGVIDLKAYPNGM